MNLKDATVVLDGLFRHIPQRAIGSILRLSSVRRISFTTPPDHCAALAEQAKALYSAEASDSQKILVSWARAFPLRLRRAMWCMTCLHILRSR